jgi:hypothetical protein
MHPSVGIQDHSRFMISEAFVITVNDIESNGGRYCFGGINAGQSFG